MVGSIPFYLTMLAICGGAGLTGLLCFLIGRCNASPKGSFIGTVVAWLGLFLVALFAKAMP